MIKPPPYCGDPAMALGLLPRLDTTGGVRSLFADRRVGYSFNTRVAIRKACDLLGLVPGDEVLAPAYNCGSELDPLRHAGLLIRLYPVSEAAEVDHEQVARLIGPRTRAIYLTHYFGFLQPATTVLRALCDTHGLKLIEDCALSLLSGTRPADGRTGDVAVFCFYKFFPVLAGGALVLNDPGLPLPAFSANASSKVVAKGLARAGLGVVLGAERAAGLIRKLKGWGTSASTPHADCIRPDMPEHYYFDPELRNVRLTGFTARALAGLDPVAAISARRANYTRALQALAEAPNLSPLFPVLMDEAVPLSMPVRVGHCRNALVAALQAEGIPATPWWSSYNCHLDFSHPDLAIACALKDEVLSLPCHQYLGFAQIDHIMDRLCCLSRECGQTGRIH
jgi:dTDP-4-amino-4,6-dideoxygalactose transaminase